MSRPSPRARSLAIAQALLCVAWVAGGCLDHELPPEDEDGDAANGGGTQPEVFIALQRDFADFLDWQAFEVDAVEHAGAQGKVVTYLNHLPPRDADAFPVGTMLVKTVEVGKPTTWTVHAMVKRGGTFNEQGAFGWEYFDLAINGDGVPVILWRGEEPPADGGYTVAPGVEADGSMESDCNGCHGAERSNDHVLGDMLDLDALS